MRHLLRTQGEEILDVEGLSERGRRILSDLDRWNRLAGWYTFHLRQVHAHWKALGQPRPFRVLDVGTGPGGLLDAIAGWAGREGIPVELTGLDRSPAYAAIARERLGDRARVIVGDATALPGGEGAWDLATSTLMLHHLPPEVRRAMVAELARVTRSVYLFDVELTLYGMLGWAVVAPALGLGRDAVHDGILSVRRACTHAELRELVRPLPVRVRRVLPSAMCTVPVGASSGSRRALFDQ